MKGKQRVLLTGGSRGIGAAIKLRLSGEYEVVAPERSQLDLESIKSISSFFLEEAKFDILINCAGINIIKPIEKITYQDMRKVNTINLESPLLLMQKCIPYMKLNRYGRIVNVSSIWGISSKAQRTLYSGSKFGLIGYTKALAKELGNQNILVNAICPGFTNTELTSESLSPKQLEDIVSHIPLQRMAEPNEIAELVYFLTSKNNAYLTGQAITLDGGFL